MDDAKPAAAAEPAKAAKGKKNADKKVKENNASKATEKAKAADAPKTTTVDKLPGALKAVHVCAMPKASVEFNSERYAKSVLFFVSCTAAKGGLTPFAVYMARDANGTAAKLVTFEGLKPDGTPDKLEMLYSVTPAREAYAKAGEERPNQHKDDVVWLLGAWAPDDRPGVCAVSAQWRIEGDKGELFLWEEAKECPKDALPKYEAKIDKKRPPLVWR